MGIGDWVLRSGVWGLEIGDSPQSPIPNPQSPIPNPQEKNNIYFLYFLLIKKYFLKYFIIILIFKK